MVAQFLSLLVLGIAEVLYLLVLARVVFGQSLGDHPGTVFAILALFVAAASGIGIMLGATLNTARQAAAVGSFVTLVMYLGRPSAPSVDLW